MPFNFPLLLLLLLFNNINHFSLQFSIKSIHFLFYMSEKLKITNYKDDSLFLSKEECISLEKYFNKKYPKQNEIQSLADIFYSFYLNTKPKKEILIENYIFDIITSFFSPQQTNTTIR